MKYTAVEWLVEQICTSDMANLIFQKEIKQAKAMEKEQRIKDYNAGHTDGLCNHINDAENYINEQNYLKDENTTH
jgi:hypothetical protein